MAHNTTNISAQRKTHHTQLKMTSTENLALFLVLVFFLQAGAPAVSYCSGLCSR